MAPLSRSTLWHFCSFLALTALGCGGPLRSTPDENTLGERADVDRARVDRPDPSAAKNPELPQQAAVTDASPVAPTASDVAPAPVVAPDAAPGSPRTEPATTSASFDVKKPVCIVLSIGAEQGLAHFGVLEELRRREVKVDCIVGTSIGALVGALYLREPGAAFGDRYRETLGSLDVVLSWSKLRDRLASLWPDRIENLSPRFVTAHQVLTASGGRIDTIDRGILGEEVALSLANPLLFRDVEIAAGTKLDPGLDRASRVPLEIACEKFPQHRFIVSNVTGEAPFHSTRMTCPFLEVRIARVDVNRSRALLGLDPEFKSLSEAGRKAAVRALEGRTF